MDPMLFSWQNECTENVRQKDLSTKNATRRNTQLRQTPGYHETLSPNDSSVHYTESILLVSDWNVKENYAKIPISVDIKTAPC